jgi:hypothetical protein
LIVVEVESPVWPFLNRLDMIRMQVLLVRIASPPQFIEHILARWKPEKHLAVVTYDLRFPPAVGAAPAVALEAEEPQPPMSDIVSAFGTAATKSVVVALLFAPMLCARSAVGEFGTAGYGARTAYPGALKRDL